MEIVVLAIVALIVFGPDKLPQLAKDGARMLRTLRDLAQGARSQLSSELGSEFGDIDLKSLNPRTAIQQVLLGDEDFSDLNPVETLRRSLLDEPRGPNGSSGANGHHAGPGGPAAAAASTVATTSPVAPGTQRRPPSEPLAEGERPPFDSDAT